MLGAGGSAAAAAPGGDPPPQPSRAATPPTAPRRRPWKRSARVCRRGLQSTGFQSTGFLRGAGPGVPFNGQRLEPPARLRHQPPYHLPHPVRATKAGPSRWTSRRNSGTGGTGGESVHAVACCSRIVSSRFAARRGRRRHAVLAGRPHLHVRVRRRRPPPSSGTEPGARQGIRADLHRRGAPRAAARARADLRPDEEDAGTDAVRIGPMGPYAGGFAGTGSSTHRARRAARRAVGAGVTLTPDAGSPSPCSPTSGTVLIVSGDKVFPATASHATLGPPDRRRQDTGRSTPGRRHRHFERSGRLATGSADATEFRALTGPRGTPRGRRVPVDRGPRASARPVGTPAGADPQARPRPASLRGPSGGKCRSAENVGAFSSSLRVTDAQGARAATIAHTGRRCVVRVERAAPPLFGTSRSSWRSRPSAHGLTGRPPRTASTAPRSRLAAATCRTAHRPRRSTAALTRGRRPAPVRGDRGAQLSQAHALYSAMPDRVRDQVQAFGCPSAGREERRVGLHQQQSSSATFSARGAAPRS